MKYYFNLKKERIYNGLTQEELARRVGVSRVQIQRYENWTSEPRLSILMKILDVLGVNELNHIVAKDESDTFLFSFPLSMERFELETSEFINNKIAQYEYDGYDLKLKFWLYVKTNKGSFYDDLLFFDDHKESLLALKNVVSDYNLNKKFRKKMNDVGSVISFGVDSILEVTNPAVPFNSEGHWWWSPMNNVIDILIED